MFICNKYYTWYMNIIHNAKLRNIGEENHHIIPKSFGGANNKENLVKLNLREHFICHILLTKCVASEYKNKMVKAAYLMSCSRTINSRIYKTLKNDFYESCKGPKNWTTDGLKSLSDYAKLRTGTSNPFYGKTHTAESKELIRQKQLGKKPVNRRKVLANNIMYDSVTDCAEAIGKSAALVIHRINNVKYDYSYV